MQLLRGCTWYTRCGSEEFSMDDAEKGRGSHVHCEHTKTPVHVVNRSIKREQRWVITTIICQDEKFSCEMPPLHYSLATSPLAELAKSGASTILAASSMAARRRFGWSVATARRTQLAILMRQASQEERLTHPSRHRSRSMILWKLARRQGNQIHYWDLQKRSQQMRMQHISSLG